MLISGASDRKKEKFPHFFPAKKKKCFQSRAHHLEVEKCVQKRSVRLISSQKSPILANLDAAVWIPAGNEEGEGFCLCMFERIWPVFSRESYLGLGFFGNKISFLTFVCA